MRAILSVLAAAYGVLVLVGAILAGLVIGTLTLPPFVFVPRGRRERWTIAPAAAWATGVVRWLLWTRVEVEGAVDLPPERGAVVLCNHRSWLDPLLLLSELRANGLSKKEILWIPVLGAYGWLAGTVFFDRRDPHDRMRARAEVRKLVAGGARIQVYPEGTRSRTGALAQRVFLTVPIDCFRDGVPVVCCAVVGTERALPATVFGAFPGHTVRLRIGRTLHPGDFPDAHTFARACWDEVVAGVGALCPGRDSNPHSPEGRGF